MDRYRTCPHCDGECSFERARPFPDDPYFCETIPCPRCSGSGYVPGDESAIDLHEIDEMSPLSGGT